MTGAKVLRNGTEFAAGTVTVWSDETNTFVCEAGANVDYTVCWKLDGGTVSTDKSYTLPTRLQTGTHTLSVEFAKPTSEKKTLTVEANKSRRGDVKYGLRVGSSIDFNLEKNEVVTVTAVAKSGYEFSYWTSEDIKIADRDKYDSELTITMIDKNAKVTAVFVEKSSPSHTHKWVEKFNDTYHWKECSRCGDKTSKEKHTIIYAYDKYGYRYDKCKYCDWTSDYSYNHSSSHKDYTYEDINATYHWKTCKKCDYSVKEYHTWIKNTDRKTRDSYPYVCKYCDRLSKTDYTDLPFYDVDGNVWYYDDVLYAYINGYMDGLSAGQFAPNQNTTRAQIVTILWRLTGEPRAMKSNKFNDVPSNAYYDKAVSWAVEAGVVNGFDAKTFKPNDYVTREQLAAILYRYAEYMNLSTRGASNLMKYDDYYQIGTWARDAMAWANYHGLINGVSYSRIDPKGNATRAQVAAILHRFAVEFGNY
ncbi:MAG: S-layer homology domain-containing protein [Clostridiales bacterium]|nr:S-layer homology domain-containing protein [Clostridiales bacterium]